ncbi:unnamed protein product [Cylindrotheca closterium]|uniref:Uncharacterized protein n=1 Tax=Cylindrotheca closterium TaxID=2856 RepID=A0AAD2JGI6_9STRA|nr:unnamed protein product [Cylindrotheca closterium]
MDCSRYSSTYKKDRFLSHNTGLLMSTLDDEVDVDVDASFHLYNEVGEKGETSDTKWMEGDTESISILGPKSLLVSETAARDNNIVSPSESSCNNVSSKANELANLSYLTYDEDASQMELIMDKALQLAPFFMPLVAYSLYDPTAIAFAATIEFLKSSNWVAVDGGSYQAMIIAPVINGVIIPSIALMFAIQIGLTISKLWKRTNDIRMCITMEASKLIMLRNLLSDFPLTNETQEKCEFYLLQYTSRLISECHETVNIGLSDIKMDSELNACMKELNKAAAAPGSSGYCAMLVDQAMAAVESLSQNRSTRIGALQSTFPMLHYVLLTTLALSICFAFLMETDQDILVFLNAIQLRILWTMLVGTFSALGLVCYDLEHPFRGLYQISDSVKELYDVRLEYTASTKSNGEHRT